jgi:periplasmic copper chaperone A
MRSIWLMVSLCSLALAGCGGASHDVQNVEGAWVRLSAVSGNPSAAYFKVNGGPVADRLMSVSTPLAIRAELHSMKMEGGMMKMDAIKDGVAVPAKGEIAFESGGKHVMLFDVSPKVIAGGEMPLTLSFASGAMLETKAKVVAAGADEPGHHNH